LDRRAAAGRARAIISDLTGPRWFELQRAASRTKAARNIILQIGYDASDASPLSNSARLSAISRSSAFLRLDDILFLLCVKHSTDLGGRPEMGRPQATLDGSSAVARDVDEAAIVGHRPDSAFVVSKRASILTHWRRTSNPRRQVVRRLLERSPEGDPDKVAGDESDER
jgi:hypothetical protein